MANDATQGRHIVIAVDATKRDGRGSQLKETTNVYRATLCIGNSSSYPGEILYIPGLGVEGSSYQKLKGLLTGSGIDGQICKAYGKICREYSSSEDKLILIGYSRGAFAVRCLVDLITKFGVLAHVQSDEEPKLIFESWKAGKLEDDAPSNLRREPVSRGNIVCVLWDTVGAVTKKLLRLIDSETEDGGFNYHALSLHERRKQFLPTVMRFRQAVPLTVSEQCWFVGYHGDIGGGRKKNALANVALAWALGKLSHHLEPNWGPLERIEDTPGDAWKIERRGEKVVFDIKDTRKGWSRLLRARGRHPKRDFWRGSLHETLPVTREVHGRHTQETMHVTVRGLLEHMDRPPQGLENARPLQRPSGVRHWALYGQDWFSVDEADVTPEESRGLNRWLNQNLRELHGLSTPGQPSPGTAIADSLDALLRYLV